MATNANYKYCILWDMITCPSNTINSIVKQIRTNLVKNNEDEFWCFTVKDLKSDHKSIENDNNIRIIQGSKDKDLYSILTSKITKFLERSGLEFFTPKIILLTGSLTLLSTLMQKRYFSYVLLIYHEAVQKEIKALAHESYPFSEYQLVADISYNNSLSPTFRRGKNRSLDSRKETENSNNSIILGCCTNKNEYDMPYTSKEMRESSNGIDSNSRISNNTNKLKNSAGDTMKAVYAHVSSKTKSRHSDWSATQDQYNWYAKPGICGLVNLGNTCFMNSAIQCLSNVPTLTMFVFYHYKNISTQHHNFGRSQKMLFDYYSDLIVNFLWSGKHSSVRPSSLRNEISRVRRQFGNYEQNDCSELMTFLLDQFHEELNIINPYRTAKIDWHSIDKTEDFSMYLSNYKIIHQSFISENFHGFQKFSLSCICGKSFMTSFSAFPCLNLPIPKTNQETKEKINENFKLLNINLIRLSKLENKLQIFEFKIHVPTQGISINDILVEAAKSYYDTVGKYIDHRHLLATEIISCSITKIYKNHDFLNGICDGITVYEISPLNDYHLFITLVAEKKGPFGLPMLLDLDDTSYKSINENFKRNLLKFLDLTEEQFTLIDMQYDINPNEKFIAYFISASNKHDVFEYPSADIDLDKNAILLAEVKFEIEEKYNWNNIEMITLENVRLQQNNYYKANLKSNNTITIYDCMDQYLSIEELTDKMHCAQCRSMQVPIKKLELLYAPNVLILQIKSSKNEGIANRRYYSNYDNVIEFPHELALDNYVLTKHPGNETLDYNLIAVANHFGSNFGGHYTTYAKNYKDNKWYNFNDSSVSSISEKQLVTQNANMLVYMRKN